ncbi:hypothetical protein GWK48_06005 [Metallosphaera tengchongensis]|uniref:CopG family transcriptional regulator n=1 Tax=Metallosphaera tengchongensis TaxID=1532350 RepID=A0A6N0NVW4_9CREN|nr:hypothetical protein [Metallosphaera tengchongensis]QKQ99992.1 hypothetical protein GWK48_06005 [Metallosphaera tengchongensis]
MRNVIIRLTDDELRKLEEEARSEGFVLITDYIKFKLFGSSAIPTKERGSSTTSVEDALNPITVELLNLKKKLGELAEKVDIIESELTESKQRTQVQESRREFREEKRPIQQEQKKSVMDYLREQKVMYERKLRSIRDPDSFFEKLERNGAKVLYTPEERIAVDPKFYDSFVNKLSKIDTSDETEVQQRLSAEEHELFQKLRKAGSIYFDNQSKSWKLTSNASSKI